MAYMVGKPLSEVLRTKKTVPATRAAALIRKLALAMEVAHAAGVIHRDLKPARRGKG
jgi:serine/threonine protein kinase